MAVDLHKDAPRTPQDATWKRTARVGWTLASHERTREAGRVVACHTLFVAGGATHLVRRGWDARTASRYERWMRSAEAAGNTELAQEWEERGRTFREQRHRRRTEMLHAIRQAPLTAAAGLGVTAAGLTGTGAALAIASGNWSSVLTPWLFTFDLIRWLVVLAAVIWGLFQLFALPLALLALWNVGRRQQAAPLWALPAAQRATDGETITPHLVVAALKNLGNGTLRKAITAMEDNGAAMLTQIRPAGCGIEVDVILPLGVSTDEIQNKRRKLAENLHRHEHELHITIPRAARTVRLWIADAGALDEPVPASPLVLDPDMRADYKTGRAPWGQTLRGDTALISLYQRHLLITGLSNQGKTFSLRALALWLALDPSVEFRIGDLKGVGDWSPFDGIATMLIEGPTDDHVMQVTHMVEDAFDEMQRRLMAPKGTTFTPLVIIVDEAQVAYGSAAKGDDGRPYGGDKNTSRYFRAVKGIHDQGRVVDVVIMEGTQDPTNQNLPKRSREGNHTRASLALGTESQSKMALGEGPVDAGAAPHKLRQGLDRGQVVVTGNGLDMPPGQVSVNVRTYFINDDQADEIAARAKALRSGVTTTTAAAEPADVDHLADIATVLGTEQRVRTTEVVHRLKNLNPPVYEHWNGPRLKTLLAGYEVDTAPYDGYPTVRRDHVHRALEDRAQDPPEDQ